MKCYCWSATTASSPFIALLMQVNRFGIAYQSASSQVFVALTRQYPSHRTCRNLPIHPTRAMDCHLTRDMSRPSFHLASKIIGNEVW
jgi:hypothetical protein